MDKHLHIISLDVPWPADYGGVVDLFYKLVWLHKAGVKIHLHCFMNDRAAQEELNKYCASVHYYPRKKKLAALSLGLPYIVSSRVHDELYKNIRNDQYPVLMEGIHCTWLLYQGLLKNRKVFVRLHNVEFQYYEKLAENESSFFKKLYFQTESRRLKKFEQRLANRAMFLTVSADDKQTYQQLFAAREIEFLPVFIPWQQVNTHFEKGCFCLYHGNLSVNENVRAVEWLLQNVFRDLSIPFVVAGKNPSPELEKLVHSFANCCLLSSPSEQEMQDLVVKAQINVLPSFNNTGVKLKLLNALYIGKFCLVNPQAASGAGVDGLCEIAEAAEGFRQAVQTLYQLPYDAATANHRQAVLDASYNNERNARQLINWLY